MTVTIPLSTFKWNVFNFGIYIDMAQNFGDYAGSSALADVTRLDPLKDMGDFSFMWEPYGSDQDGLFFMFVDNFRIVPDDGGGVIFGKIGQQNPEEGGRPF
jgi:hypothetical protein